MSQPPLPAPLAPRPEPGAQLLEAVRQRHSQRSLQLAQQWVHRRGVLDLQRFCSTQLSSALGAEAVSWLHGLLALDAPLPAKATAAPPPARPVVAAGTTAALAASEASGAPALAEAMPAIPVRQSEPVLQPQVPAPAAESPGVPQVPETLDLALHARAVAAVDEAFAALTQSFQEDSANVAIPLPAAAHTPLTIAPEAEAVPEPPSIPQPLPVRSGLWPSLRASAASLSSVLRPAEGPARLTPELGDESAAEPGLAATTPDSAGTPDPLQPEELTVAEVLTTVPAPLAGDQDAPTEPATPLSAADPQFSGTADSDPVEQPDAAPAQAGPLQRLRGRISGGRLPRLSRLRSVMRDCVDETLGLLRTPEADPGNEDGGEDGGFALRQPPEPAPPISEQPLPSWSLDPFLPPSPSPAEGNDTAAPTGPWRRHIATEAMPSPAPAASTPLTPPASPVLTAAAATAPAQSASPATAPPAGMPAASSSPAEPSAPGRSPAGRRPAAGSDRPAPAPATLSNLRAWLPGQGDLPRAS